MSSSAFLAGVRAYRKLEPYDPAEEREWRHGWKHAQLGAEEGPLGPFDVWTWHTPFGGHATRVDLGQVLASCQPEAVIIMAAMRPDLMGSRMGAARARKE